MRLRHLLALTFFAACGPTSMTDAGTPAPVSCPEGTEGCACTVGDRCGANSRGEQLLCQGAVCMAMTCPSGDPGCVCRSGSLCNDAASTCTAGFCIAAGCVPGQATCTCLAGSCDPGLACLSGAVCVDSRGYEGGACLVTGRCTRGNRCDSATGLCVFCEPGGAGCACNGNNACNPGLACTAGLCLSASQLPPANPKCFTGCRADLTTDDGGTVRCGTDDVMPGCLPGKTCLQGSCVEPGQPKPTCADDLHCPPYQVCLTGGCYSNCDANADCASGLGCFRHACRPSCVVGQGQSACPGGTACTADDGQNGYCTPVGSSTGATTLLPSGGLSVPHPSIELSNVKPTGSFMVVPNSSGVQDVTVRKLWHSSTNLAGVTERVDAPLDADGQFRTCDPARNECPLSWLSLKAPGTTVAQQTPSIAYRLLPGCVDPSASPDAGTPCPLVGVEGAGTTTAVKWEGELEVSTRDARVRVYLSYVQRPDGQWTGSMFYFGTFSNTGLAAWIDSPVKSSVANVNNGLLQRWGALRAGGLPGGWQEFLAVLNATREGSWKFANVQQRCATLGVSTAACYPFINSAGVRTYVQNPLQYPIPTGVTELPVAMNLQLNATQADLFEGRMVSSRAMHYPGNPGVKVQFTGNPSLMSSCSAAGGADCLVFLKDIKTVAADVNQLVSAVGGRYLSSDGTCGVGYTPVEVPWLIPGFSDGTRPATSGGGLSRVECRDAELPFDVAALASNAAVNKSLAGANPVPDGQPRVRTLRFLDGALVNQTELFVLFEETYTSFIPGRLPTTAYGYLRLTRAPAQLGPEDYAGLRAPASTMKTPPVPAGAQCDAQLMADLGASMANERDLVARMLDGSKAFSSGYAPVLNPAGINYYCEDTGFFNGGPGDNGTPAAVKQACPRGSKVLFFNVCNALGTTCSKSAHDLSIEPCQTQLVAESAPEGQSCTTGSDCTSGACTSGRCQLRCNGAEDCRSGICDTDHVCKRASCRATLNGWKANLASNTVTEGGADDEPLVSACVNPNDVYCDDDRLDLRNGKTFFRKTVSTGKNFLELQQLIDLAFRYKTRFRSSTSGSAVGFAPGQCVPNSDAVPYCYDPRQIEEARKRVDCLVNVYSDTGFVNTLTAGPDLVLRTRLFSFLRQNFAQVSPTHDGLERLYAELMTMLGDEALTAAYGSRFDIAAAGGANFRGSAFEPGGLDLSGVAGAEMSNLYQAVEYYQVALDRLYTFGPNMQAALSRGNPVGTDPNFIGPDTVTSYLERLVRAASQKSRAWGEIAQRYQNFNRPDLARRVIERAYLGTYLESALISRLMLDITEQSAAATLPQLRLTLDKTQRNYRMALLDMRSVYGQITDDTNYFGFAPDYVPFPALDGSSTGSSNAYEALSLLAKQRLDLARTREQTALTFGKQGKVDAVQFQSDLTSIRNTYENQLASVCGTFVADNGTVYPAIAKYAPEGTIATLMGDPCGRTGNGELNNALVALKDSALKLQGVQIRQDNLYREIGIERDRVAEQCHLTHELAAYQYTKSGMAADMQLEIDRARAGTALTVGALNGVIAVANAVKCGDTDCLAAGIAATTIGVASGLSVAAQATSDFLIADKERELKDFDRKSVKFATNNQCAVAKVDSTARIANLFNDTLETEIEALRADYGMRLALADVRKLINSAQRLQAQQQEAEGLAIDLQAAQNDPNVRIYQNDAVINADVSFNAALAAAYRLTRVYEYYTSQSYSKKEQLFLIRMVTAGQYNLENYLLELDNEFQSFEEAFGNPDVRVLALSLRDDLLQIPYLDTAGDPLTEGQRISMLRERLRDVRLLDGNGYLTIPFSTKLNALSPVTRNHKVRHVEIDLAGVNMGDAVARVYLRMSGTGVVRTVADQTDFHVFPARLGVVNASLLGAKPFDPEVYRNYRFRDRPLVNTMWELVINQRDEQANQDIDLQTLTDLRVLFYYSDHTSL
jgi:hypothetical protein